MDLELVGAGIQWWVKTKPDWRTDFLNSFYEGLYAARPDELNEIWWSASVNRLAEWRAIRSPKPHNTKQEIFDRGSVSLATWNQRYQHMKRRAGNHEPSLENMEWADVAPLFNDLCEIKLSRSPVFASKLGHFMLPRTFIVLDNEATGLAPYEVAWRGLKAAWHEFEEKKEASVLLEQQIRKPGCSVHADYPFETKIAEMWLIGYNHRQDP